nr:S8 family peptidase [Burkholderia ambifaria]
MTHPDRARVFATAVTASDYRDCGRPSSWSAMLERLASDVDGGGETPRLFVLASGNTRSHDAWMTYPDSLATNVVHDPGQAWNAPTVGACTRKIDTEIAGLAAIAAEDGLSPFTTMSRTWDSAWPLNPGVVFEGGNVGKDKLGASGVPALNLLTTHNVPDERLFTTTNATIAASALCARMAARIMAAYPQFRAEMVRALIVHAAEWTPAMRQMFLPAGRQPRKQDYVNFPWTPLACVAGLTSMVCVTSASSDGQALGRNPRRDQSQHVHVFRRPIRMAARRADSMAPDRCNRAKVEAFREQSVVLGGRAVSTRLPPGTPLARTVLL